MRKRDVVLFSAGLFGGSGTFGGFLSRSGANRTGGIVMKEIICRSGADPKLINYVTVGKHDLHL